MPSLIKALLACVLLVSGCGPTDEEAGRAVMLAAPIVLLVGTGIMRFLLFLWRRLEPGLDMSMKPSLVAFWVLAGGAVLSLVGITEPPAASGQTPWQSVTEWLPAALILFGNTSLALWLVTWRVWLLIDPARAFSWSGLPVLAVLLIPAPFMAFGSMAPANDFIFLVWVFPGYMGIVPPCLLGLLLLEFFLRYRKMRRDREA